MDEADFEARLSARLHARFDSGEPSEALLRRIANARGSDSRPARRVPAAWALATAIALVILAGVALLASQTRPGIAGPSPSPATSAPTVSPTASPSPAGNVPYRISIQTTPNSAGPTTTISRPSDCNVMPSDWLLQVCALALRPDWQSIIAATDPLGPRISAGPGPSQVGSASWWAALVRASIDDDTSLCRDASMRWWITLGSVLGGSPQAKASPQQIHPVATCLDSFLTTARQGSFSVTDESHLPDTSTVTFFVDPAAIAPLAPGAAPIFDPEFGCDPGSLTRDTCNELLLAVITSLDADRQDQVYAVAMRAGSSECLSSASPCAPPSGGTWLGNVVARTGPTSGFAFDVAFIAGEIVTTEVPYQP